MCKELLVIPKKWRASEEERHKGLLTKNQHLISRIKIENANTNPTSNACNPQFFIYKASLNHRATDWT
jgi:hypothetical protein